MEYFTYKVPKNMKYAYVLNQIVVFVITTLIVHFIMGFPVQSADILNCMIITDVFFYLYRNK